MGGIFVPHASVCTEDDWLSSLAPGSEFRFLGAASRVAWDPADGRYCARQRYRRPLSWPRELVKNSSGWDARWESLELGEEQTRVCSRTCCLSA